MNNCLIRQRIVSCSRQNFRCQSLGRNYYTNSHARRGSQRQLNLVKGYRIKQSSAYPRTLPCTSSLASPFSSTTHPFSPSTNSPGSGSGSGSVSGFGKVSDTPPTDFAALDVLGDLQGPAAGVEVITNDGFKLSNGIRIDGAGVMLIDGEAFKWRPWLARGYDEEDKQNVRTKNKLDSLRNARGQWLAHESCWGLLDLVWPKPGNSGPFSFF